MYVAQGFCDECNKKVKIEKKGLRHILHIFLSIITCGFWLIPYVFLLMAAAGGYGWRCSVCGSDEVTKR